MKQAQVEESNRAFTEKFTERIMFPLLFENELYCRDVEGRVAKLAGALRNEGVGVGDRCAILSLNSDRPSLVGDRATMN